VAIEHTLFKQLRSRVCEPGVLERGARVVTSFEEPAEVRGGRRAIETVVVIEDSHPHVGLAVIGKPFSFSQFGGKSKYRRGLGQVAAVSRGRSPSLYPAVLARTGDQDSWL